jgi:hypothetical protein
LGLQEKQFLRKKEQRRQLCVCLKKLDAFGTPVYLTYQGEEKFKTRSGAAMTILVILLTLTFLSVQLATLISG